MRSWSANAERLIWYLLLASLGLQTRLILWQADAQFVEWRSVSIHATDVLFAGLLIFAFFRLWRNWRLEIGNWKLRPWDLALAVLFVVSALSVFRAFDARVAWFHLAKLAEGLLLYAYVRWYAYRRFAADFSLMAFVLGCFAQAALGLGQFFFQHDLGQRWAGETLLTVQMRGVAVFYDLAGDKVLRAYGTLPHPNVLAAYLAMAAAALGYLFLRHAGATVRRACAAWVGAGVLLVWGLAATFSRTVLAAAVAALAVPFTALASVRVSRAWPNAGVLRRRAYAAFIVTLIAALLFAVAFWPQVLSRLGITSQEEAVVMRAYYNSVAIGSGTGLWGVNWTGVGIGNFVTWMHESNPHLPAWQYQPAHNLYLLVYTETGILGVSALLAFLALLISALVRARRVEPLVRWGLAALAGFVLFIALFDHFFWTLQQGRLLFWLFWGAVAGGIDSTTKK